MRVPVQPETAREFIRRMRDEDRYPDTSLLVAMLTNEAETERIQRWFGRQRVDELAISDWW
jgi:hypothetical protein